MATLVANRPPIFTRAWFFVTLALMAAGLGFSFYLSGSIREWEYNFVRSTPHFYFDAFMACVALWPSGSDMPPKLRILCAAGFGLAAIAKVLLWEMPQLGGVLPFVILVSEYFGLIQFFRYCMTIERRPPAPTRWWRVMLLIVGSVVVSVAMAYAMLLPDWKAEDAIEQKRYDVAIRYLTAEIWLSPIDGPGPYLQRGRAYYLSGRYDQAIGDFDIAIRIRPRYANEYLWRGSALFHAEHQSRAIADFNEAIRLDPTYAVAYERRGLSYLDMGNYQAAIDDLTTAMRLDPSIAAYRSRGMSNFRLGHVDRAIADFFEAIRRKPDDASSYYERGIAYWAKGDQQRANADFDAAMGFATEATRSDPRDANALEAIAWMLATSPQPDKRNGKQAIEYTRRVVDLKGGSDASSLDTLATAYAEAGDFDAAVKWEKKAIQLSDEPQPRRHHRLDLFESKHPYHEQ